MLATVPTWWLFLMGGMGLMALVSFLRSASENEKEQEQEQRDDDSPLLRQAKPQRLAAELLKERAAKQTRPRQDSFSWRPKAKGRPKTSPLADAQEFVTQYFPAL
ncbi:MAG: hypothetical protein U9Q70_07360 [Chloroflexota bacterium]|nr:hypothetical protein [Chloroflexota bacterium]